MLEFCTGMDFPDFTRHFLAWKNSLLQTVLEKHLQCDYVVWSDCRVIIHKNN
jgi:hypothetical protein